METNPITITTTITITKKSTSDEHEDPTDSFESPPRGRYAYFFFHELIPVYPLYGIMFVERGLDPAQLSALFVAWSVAGLVAEVPSGALADIVPRKRLLVASSLCKAATYAIWLFIPHFWGFLVGFVCWGISGALRSGTAEAMLHDTLRESGRESDFTRAFGRIRATATVSIGIAMFGGSLLIRFGYGAVLGASIAALCLASATAAYALREPSRSAGPQAAGYFDALRAGIGEALTNRTALFIVLLSLVLLPLGGAFDEFVGPVLNEKGFDKQVAAALFALVYLAQVSGMLAAHRVQQAKTTWPLLILMGAGGLLAAAGWGGRWLAPVAIAGFFALFSLASTLFAGRLQAAIQGPARATVTSLSGAAMHVGSAAVFALFGAAAQGHAYSHGVYAFATVAVAGAAAFAALARFWRID